jgi:putative SOS response-associated peptidase YedK
MIEDFFKNYCIPDRRFHNPYPEVYQAWFSRGYSKRIDEMCGRFVLLTDLRVIVETFHVQHVACEYKPGHNISPGQEIAAVIHDDRNRLVSYRWGLIPSWAKDSSIGNRMFNARSETLTEKPSFRNAFQKRRCLIVADGFYEWQIIDRIRKPLRFSLKSGEPFGLAGLYETWISPEQKPVHTCTIVTTDPNGLMRPIHDRMPVMVPKEREAAWIDPDNRNQKELLSILKPYPEDEMTMSRVDPGSLHKPKAQIPVFLNP